ncbi:RPA-related protein RADX isoform X2 [Betta splendens]|uniref:RPA-related protein RADX isoform X2 n=1 Tax=Betta splendens TaxID=158456 RepID=A0A6P7LY13_BETSP|nr:RPA-related protein RADX isoform X2 [Betta splendens]
MHRSVIVTIVSNMAAAGCVFHRTLARSRLDPSKASSSSSSSCVCRDLLYVVDLHRYSRDQGSSVYFPQSVLSGDDLYDVTVTDGDCRLRVTLDPGLNKLVERNVLAPGSTLRNATFTPALSAQLPACTGASDSYRLVSMEVVADGVRREDVDVLPWFRSSQPTGTGGGPLRANRSVFLPLWNNVDYSGDGWRGAPPAEEEEDEDTQEAGQGLRPAVTVSELRDSFLSGRRPVARGFVQHQLIVRIISKSHLMYYGRTEQNCECPYKAVLEVCDQTGSVCVVLWNSVCVDWYRCLKPGDIIGLRRYRVKPHYQAERGAIEISVNSRNPAAQISVVPESSLSPEYLPPAPTYSFYTSKQLLERPHGSECDVIGLIMFSGRSERIRNKAGGAELLEYHWLSLEDGTSDQPIRVKLFSTSQPETHSKLHPLSVVVCTRLRCIRDADRTNVGFYLTNTSYTQVYCTGLGHHSEMSYRKLRPVRQFLQWLRSQDDGQVLSRALIGGFFIHPPPAFCLENYMKDRRGEPGFLRGVELQRELERLCYRERQTFCIQATVAMVTYCRRGEEDRSMFWSDRASSLPSPSSSSLRPSPILSFPSTPSLTSTPRSFRSSSPSSSIHQLTPLPRGAGRTSRKRKQQLQEQTPKRRQEGPVRLHEQRHHEDGTSVGGSAVTLLSLCRLPRFRLQPEQNTQTVILFEASREFLDNTNADEDKDSTDEDAASFVISPLPPDFTPIALETLPMRFDYTHREEQAVAVAMGGRVTAERQDWALEDYYTLRLRALSDSLMVDAVFLPHASTSPLLPHSNTWISILSHGAFSSHAPPPSPADLIAMATQLTNQRLVCVLEACHLGGARTELILSRAFHLTD